MNLLQGKHSSKPQLGTDKRCLAVLLILLSGDIQLNTGPGNRSILSCGTCDTGSLGLRKEFAVTTAVYGITNHERIKPDKDPDKNAIKSSTVPLAIQFIGMTEELEQVVVYLRLLKKAS